MGPIFGIFLYEEQTKAQHEPHGICNREHPMDRSV